MQGDDRTSTGAALDTAIDAAAQVLTHGEPSPQLRITIRERIEKSRAPWSIPRWIPAVAVVAVLVVSVVVVREYRTHPAQQTLRSSVEHPIVAPPDVVAPRQRERPERAERIQWVQRPGRRLVPVAPIVIEPLNVPLMAVDNGSAAMPIEIKPLQIEPLRSE